MTALPLTPAFETQAGGVAVRSTVVIVSPYFPPSSVAGVHRSRHLANHLEAHGWHPIILCVDEAHHEEELDPALASLVRPNAEIIKVRALSSSTTRLIGIGDLGIRAFSALRSAIFRLLNTRRIDAVLITGSPFYPMLLAPEIRRRYSVPIVLDFQDPWVSNWGAHQSVRTKAGLSHALACRLEPRALRAARFVTSVSETQNAEMAGRYPWLDEARMAAIPIGGDPGDFEQLRRSDLVLPAGVLDPARINLSFVGTVMPRSGPLLRLILRALARLRHSEPALGQRLRLSFIGSSNQPGRRGAYRVLPVAAEEGVADAVHEIPERLPFLQAIAILVRSEGVLLIGSDEAHYTASKIYPALMCGRPFISLFHQASSSHHILTAAGGGAAHAYLPGADTHQLVQEIATSLRALAMDRDSFGRVDASVYAAYEARSVAARFAQVLDEAVLAA